MVSRIIFPCPKRTTHKNTNTKYINTAYEEMPERPNMWYIFEKRIVQWYQKLYSYLLNAQIHKYKYRNTAYDEVPERIKHAVYS